MNQIFLSAVFLQNSLSYQPRKRIFRPQIRVERSLQKIIDLKNESFAGNSGKNFNKDFYRQLARQKKNKIHFNSSLIRNTRDGSEISRNSQKNNFLNKNNAQKTTLIIAPHPDDEILGTANLIKEKLKSREKIKIIYLTNGDALRGESFEDAKKYGLIRKNESIKAAKKLGLKNNDLFFLGFPDGYLDKMNKNIAIRSEFTGQTKTSTESYFPNYSYTRMAVYNSLKKLINEIRPDEIYYTSPRDSHPDHSFLGNFMYKNFIQTPAKKFTYLIHNKNCLNDICPKNREIDYKKLELIKFFKSQETSAHNKKFLNQFAAQREFFWELK